MPRNYQIVIETSRAASLHLEYGLVDDPIVNEFGLELNCSGEVSENGKGATPFGAAPMQLLSMQNSTPMLQIVVSDYVTNSLMYHGHKYVHCNHLFITMTLFIRMILLKAFILQTSTLHHSMSSVPRRTLSF
ncbi:unnamed protein product [Anisakis simplex]|uniref:BPI2 domain-containing protein n=1 Tax=Anisakis simplex TaxID=6269 RepID=A0A0M3JEC3_ANISI|nr:unnamed protein product [Anisakis simplex]